MPLKANFQSFPTRPLAANFANNPRRYSWLKLKLVFWKVADIKQKALFSFFYFYFMVPHAYEGVFRFELWKLSQTLSKIPSVASWVLATPSGSLGLLNSTKKVILVEGRRLPKCANQGGFYITLASPLVLSLFLCSFSTFLPKCILDSLLQIFALVKLEYIKW